MAVLGPGPSPDAFMWPHDLAPSRTSAVASLVGRESAAAIIVIMGFA